jgi:CheY-like chemotaxis protein
MGKKVLIVDDDPVVRLLLQECLSVHGHEIEAFANPQAGLEWLASNTPDIAMVDMIMPEMSGLELLKRIRAVPQQAALPVILLSANADRKLATIDADARPDRIIEKPWDMAVLIEAIEQLTSIPRT